MDIEAKISSARARYRWCDRQEQYIAIAACRKKAETRAGCRRCFVQWQRQRLQLPLPLRMPASGR